MITADLPEATSVRRVRQRRLLAWFDRQGRDLPWRRRPTLYGIWVAETMLQQTTVAAVVGRWEMFLARFPDVRTLAAAAPSEVMNAWSGLGYYRRARLLHQAAQRLQAEHGGRLPLDLASWRTLPGVGEYTAAAVASIGLGCCVPVIDVNVRRVLLRWYFAAGLAAAAVRPSTLRSLAAANLACDRPGDWNQALMDLGAEICTAARPACPRCPVRRWCAAGLAGVAAQVPLPAARAPAKEVSLSVLALRHAGRTLMLPSAVAMSARVSGLGRPLRTSMAGLLTGLWSPPMTFWYGRGHGQDAAPYEAAWRRWLRDHGWRRPTVAAVGRHPHTITTHRLCVVVAVAHWPPQLPPPSWVDAVWAAELEVLPLASLTRRSLAVAQAAEGFAGS